MSDQESRGNIDLPSTAETVTLDRPVLTIDPKRQFGKVCIAGTRIPAKVLAGCVAAGDGVDDVAEAYEITRDEVLLACLWFGWESCGVRRKFEQQVAKAWEGWMDEALFVLGGHAPGPLDDPPPIDGSPA